MTEEAPKKTKKPRKPLVGSDATKGSRVALWQWGLYAFGVSASVILIGAALNTLIRYGRFSPTLGAIALLLTLMTWTLITAKSASFVEPTGVTIATAEPELYGLVQSAADAIGAPMPDDVYLVAEAEIAFNESTRYFGLRVERTVLSIGMPFMHALTVRELSALVTHELAHRTEGDVDNGLRSSRALAAGRDMIKAEGGGFVNAVYGSYARKMFRSIGGVGVAHETAAERAAADAFGTDALLGAIRKLDDIPVAFDQLLRHYIVPGLQSKVHPENLFEGFGELLQSSARAESRVADVERRASTERYAFDLHLAPRERAAVVEAWPTVDGSAPATSVDDELAHTLLDADARSSQIVVGLWASKLIGTQTTHQSWQQLAEEVYSVESHTISSLVVDPDDEVDPDEQLKLALQLAETGEWDGVDAAVKKPLKRIGEVEARREEWARCVVLEAAATSDEYTWEHNWDGPPKLVDRAGNTFDAGLVAALIAQGKPTEAREALAASIARGIAT